MFHPKGITTTGLLPAALGFCLLAGCGGGTSFDGETPESPTPALPACPAGLESSGLWPSTISAPVCDESSFDTYTDLAYAPHARGLLDLMIPRSATTPLPLVIWIHGGGWKSGDKSNRELASRLLCRGYALAAVNYRLSNTDMFPAQIQDVKAAIRFLRANAATYGVDSTRIAAFGSSAGGHLAALAATTSGVESLEDLSLGNPGESSNVQATVDWYGPTRFSDMDTQLLAQGCPASSARHSDEDSAESEVLGCLVGDATCEDAVRRADPANYADASDPPILLLHGTEDCVVPYEQSTRLREHLDDAGACAVQRTVHDAAHGGPPWTSPEVQDAIADFLDRVLE